MFQKMIENQEATNGNLTSLNSSNNTVNNFNVNPMGIMGIRQQMRGSFAN